MDTIHDTLSPLVAAYPIISLIAALVAGFGLGALVFRKKKKDH